MAFCDLLQHAKSVMGETSYWFIIQSCIGPSWYMKLNQLADSKWNAWPFSIPVEPDINIHLNIFIVYLNLSCRCLLHTHIYVDRLPVESTLAFKEQAEPKHFKLSLKPPKGKRPCAQAFFFNTGCVKRLNLWTLKCSLNSTGPSLVYSDRPTVRQKARNRTSSVTWI